MSKTVLSCDLGGVRGVEIWDVSAERTGLEIATEQKGHRTELEKIEGFLGRVQGPAKDHAFPLHRCNVAGHDFFSAWVSAD